MKTERFLPAMSPPDHPQASALIATLTSRREKRWLAVFVALYLICPFFGRNWRLELPIAWQGDEPHYMVMVSSLLQDGDLDLRNNYEAMRHGSLDAGRKWAGALLDDHTTWWRDGRRVEWGSIHEPIRMPWPRDAEGHPVTTLLPGHEHDMDGVIERPMHPPGFPWMLAAFLWPLRGTPYVESAAILLVTLSTIVALVLFHGLVRRWARSDGEALCVTAAAFLGTPVWHYSRKLFAEAPLTLCAVGALYFILRRSRPWVAGCFLAAGTLMKPPFLLLAIPPAVLFLMRRDLRSLVFVSIPCLISVAATLGSNAVMFGSPWRSPQPFSFGNPLVGLRGLLLSEQHGFLAYSPVAAAALVGWPTVWREHRSEARLIAGAVLLYFALMCTWAHWEGGFSYGPRLVLPVLPFAMMGLCGLRAPWLRGVAVALGVVSVGTNFVSAAGWSHVTAENPLSTLTAGLRRK
jgi:hypothetical protein